MNNNLSALSIVRTIDGTRETAECVTCGSGLIRAVVLSDGQVYGLDCAARAMGAPRRRVKADAATMATRERRERGQEVVRTFHAAGGPIDFDWPAHGFVDYFEAMHGCSAAAVKKAHRRR